MRWTIKLRFLIPSLAHFPRPINICSLDVIRVQILRENTLLRVSPPFFLNHFRVCDFVHFYFGFGVILKNSSTRGPHSTVELSLEHLSSHIHFVSLNSYSLLISFIIMNVIDMILIDLWVVTKAKLFSRVDCLN